MGLQEVWTLCRIFKRNVSYRKYAPDWRELSAKRQPPTDKNSKTCSVDSNRVENYVSFGAPLIQLDDKRLVANHGIERKQFHVDQSSSIAQPPSMASSSNISSQYENELLTYGDWDELRSVVECAFDPSLL